MWHEFFDKIYCINLNKRTDRFIDFCCEAEKIGLPFERVAAVERDKGAEGLLITVVQLFRDALDKGYESILIMEDDCEFVEDKLIVDDTMNKAITQLPEDWLILYLGAQLSTPIQQFFSPNLIPVDAAFATHSWAISNKGMELILASSFSEPIDNHIVAHIQKPYGNCFHTYPILTTQREGYSNIGNANIAWDAFITQRFAQRIMELRQRGYQIPV